MKLTKEQKQLMLEGDPEPDIVKEAKACLLVLFLFVLAFLVMAAVIGGFWCIQQLIEWLLC